MCLVLQILLEIESLSDGIHVLSVEEKQTILYS